MNNQREPRQKHEAAVADLAVIGDGSRILSISHDGTIRMWSAEDAAQVGIIRANTCKAGRLAVDGTGSRAVAGWWDGTMRIYDLLDLKEEKCIRIPEDPHHGGPWPIAVAISEDGHIAVSGSQSLGVTAWNADEGREIFNENFHSKPITSVALDWDDGWVVSGSVDRTIVVRNFLDATVEKLEGHEDWVNDVALTPDQRWVVSASDDFTVRGWDLGSTKVTVLHGHSAEVKAVDIDPTGRRVVSASKDHTVKTWDLLQARLIATFTGDSAMRACAWLPDGKSIVAGDEEGALHFLRLET